jgi:predicted secreted Zn-dependent protease
MTRRDYGDEIDQMRQEVAAKLAGLRTDIALECDRRRIERDDALARIRDLEDTAQRLTDRAGV